MDDVGAQEAAVSAERVARESYGRLLAHLAAAWRDVAAAEDALAEAFATALTAWRSSGPPANPTAWLAAAARRKLIDQRRRRRVAERCEPEAIRRMEELVTAERDGDAIPDRRLALMFVCAHPAIDPVARAPLMMQTVLGIDAARIASAFLTSPAAMGQRLARAKTKIREAGVPFAIPDADEWAERSAWVLEAVYGAFAVAQDEAFAEDPFGRGLAGEAIWLARVLVALTTDAAEALGLLALCLFIQARRGARRDARGRYVPLSEQDPRQWDAASLDEAETLLLRAAAFGSPGRFQWEAAIQSAHCVRRHGAPADWSAIVVLYERLGEFTRSSVVEVNRAVALAHAGRLSEGLAILARREAEGGLGSFQPFWAAKAELCARAGRRESATAAYDRAIGLERDPAVREFLMMRRAAA